MNEQLLAAGRITKESFVIARVDIGIGQRGGRGAVDVGSPEALKKAMLGARALRWARTGAALTSVNRILDTLDIRADAAARYRAASDAVLEGEEYELNFYPMSEILERSELINLGAVVPPLQVPAVLTAVISSAAADEKGARALIQFLQGPAIEPMLDKTGFTR